jgi:hypothetical protein
MKRNGQCPTHAAMYDEDLVEVVRSLYKQDLELYINKFGSADLLFVK